MAQLITRDEQGRLTVLTGLFPDKRIPLAEIERLVGGSSWIHKRQRVDGVYQFAARRDVENDDLKMNGLAISMTGLVMVGDVLVINPDETIVIPSANPAA